MRSTLTLAIRRLGASFSTTAFVVGALALSIGSVGAAAGLIDAMVLRKLDVRDPDRLVTIAPMLGEAILGIPGETLSQLRESQTSLSDVCGYSRGSFAIQVGSSIQRKGSESVSGRCYELLGVRAHVGRLIEQADAPLSGNAAAVVVLSFPFWRSAFGGDASVVGRTLRVEGRDLQIIGVLPQSFMGMQVDQGPDVVVPLGLNSTLLGQPPRISALYAIGRMHPSRTLEETRSELRAIWPSVWAASNPVPTPGAKPSPAADPTALQVESGARGLSDLRKLYTLPSLVLLGLAAVLVVMAAVNVAGLWTARAADRSLEFKTLAAIGATQRQIGIHVLSETLIVGALSGVSAAMVAVALGDGVARVLWPGNLPLTMIVTPSAVMLTVVGAATLVLTAALSVPALLIVRNHLRVGLAETTHASASAGWWRQGLIFAQSAITLILMFCAALLTRNLMQLRAIDPGYSSTPLSWSRLEQLPATPGEWDRVSYATDLIERAARLPGVESAAFSGSFPTTELRHLTALMPVARQGADASVGVREYRVSPGFFATIDVRLISGRDFRSDDSPTRQPVVINNASLAASLFPSTDAIGQFITLAGRRTAEVVGVVADFSPGDVRIVDRPAVYSPLFQAPQLFTTPIMVLRSSTTVPVEQLRAVVDASGRHYLGVLRSVDDHLSTLMGRERILFAVSASFAALGIAIGGSGIFVALAYSVTRRRREIAIRTAIGAQRRRVVTAIAGGVMLAAVAGLAVGVPLALGAGNAIRSLMYQPAAPDAQLLTACAAAIAVVAGLASVWPSLRAVRIDPSQALKQD